MNPVISSWLTALEARHLADLRVPEVTRALRALSSAYVERRHPHAADDAGQQRVKGTLDSAGKRAAFALFYAPLHLLAITHVLRTLGAEHPAPEAIVDLGCGTGVAGAAWALTAGSTPMVMGIDRHPWALKEALWTYRQLGVKGRVRQGDVSRLPLPSRRGAVVAAYVLNELPDAGRVRLEDQLLDAAQRGARILIVEPIARGVAPWWERTGARFAAFGGRADEWRLPMELPPMLQMFDKAAGLNHRELTLRTIFV